MICCYSWTYSDAKTTKCEPYDGEVAYYDGGGFYIDLTDDRQGTQKIIHDLKHNLWITRNTRVIFINFSLYNANLNLFAVVKYCQNNYIIGYLQMILFEFED